MTNLFLTGDISVGKTTVLKQALDRIESSIGGFTTERIINGNLRSYVCLSLYDNTKQFTIAEVDSSDWSKRVFVKAFSKDLVSILDKSFKSRDLIILDELGNLENDITPFTDKIYELLDSDRVVFGVLKSYDCEFLNRIRNREDTIIIHITEENRDSVLDHILEILQSFNIKINSE